MTTANTAARAQGATVVITHRIRPDKLADYDAWLDEIAPLCRASPGHLDWHIVRPASLGAPDHPLLTTLAVTATVVFLMVYVVMPRYTKLIKRWLFT